MYRKVLRLPFPSGNHFMTETVMADGRSDADRDSVSLSAAAAAAASTLSNVYCFTNNLKDPSYTQFNKSL